MLKQVLFGDGNPGSNLLKFKTPNSSTGAPKDPKAAKNKNKNKKIKNKK